MSTSYQRFLDEIKLEFVKKILVYIQTKSLYSDQLIYVSYRTDDKGAVLSSKVKQKYPKEITIVLQHQFEDLIINKEGFSLKVNFDGEQEKIYVPFCAITSFLDVNNGCSFKLSAQNNARKSTQEMLSTEPQCLDAKRLPSASVEPSSNVIVLDKFRKANKPT